MKINARRDRSLRDIKEKAYHRHYHVMLVYFVTILQDSAKSIVVFNILLEKLICNKSLCHDYELFYQTQSNSELSDLPE